MEKQLTEAKFYLIGNNLSIDYINTRIIIDGAPKELLESFADFLAWAVQASLLEAKQAEALLKSWSGKPQATQFFNRALKFRELLREMVRNAIQGEAIKPPVLAAINLIMKEESGYAEVVRVEPGFEKRYHADFSEPGRLLAPIAQAAADLLCYSNLSYLRKCENPDCMAYFYDQTKNHSRRWCIMALCGNRAKAAAFYQRQSRPKKR